MPGPERPRVVSREAWPALGIEHYRSIADGPWGYLLLHEDGRFEFDSRTQPSRNEILTRWSAYLTAESSGLDSSGIDSSG